MDPSNSAAAASASTINGKQENGEPVVEKSAKELKKEAQRLAKLEKFKKKQEQQAALKESQSDVSCMI